MQQGTIRNDEIVGVCTVAIRARAVLKATYNGAEMTLHPHQLVERNDATYLRAVNPAKNRREDEEAALGFYHLAGMSEVVLEGRQFEPLAEERLAPARETDRVIESV